MSKGHLQHNLYITAAAATTAATAATCVRVPLHLHITFPTTYDCSSGCYPTTYDCSCGCYTYVLALLRLHLPHTVVKQYMLPFARTTTHTHIPTPNLTLTSPPPLDAKTPHLKQSASPVQYALVTKGHLVYSVPHTSLPLDVIRCHRRHIGRALILAHADQL